MKIAIKGHASREKEVIEILENLGDINSIPLSGNSTALYYYIDYYNNNSIRCHDIKYVNKYCKKYTLEEFEKEFPFKIGDRVILKGTNNPYEIVALEWFMNKLWYKLDNGLHYAPETLTTYEKMKEERNITLTLDKAKEWYKKGGELKEIALQAFTEKELNPLPRSWEEFCTRYSKVDDKEYFIDSDSNIEQVNSAVLNHYRLLNADRNICSSKKSAEAHLAMIQLEQLRDCWRQGWKPNWLDGTENKYAINSWRNDYSIVITYSTHEFLSFPTYKMAKEFLECFRDLIEKAGDLI